MSDETDPADSLSSSRERGAVIAGRYRIEREIGRGGMATVYLAHDIRHDRQVALKFIHAEVADALATERFRREIALLARLTHPHILPLYDSGESEGVLFYVMPYIAGESLRSRLAREHQLPVDEAVRLCREVADALAYAHANDVIHRDVKPENILLSEGHALVADFGIAHAVSRAGFRRLTDAGFAIGTLAYMSPEQGSGDPVDGRSDVYSLGCVLYEALTGDVPFTGTTAIAVLAKRHSEPPRPARQLRRGLAPAVDATIAKALSAVPEERFQSMAEFSAALARAEEQSAAQPARLVIPPRWRWVAGAVGLAALIAAFFAFRPAPLDPELYVVLPFVHRAGAAPQLLDGDNCQQLLYEAFGRWNGITLVDDMRAHDARARGGTSPLSLEDALRTAKSLRAGRLAWGEVWIDRGNIQVRGLIYDVGRKAPVKQYAVTLRPDLGDAERKFTELADTLLVPAMAEGRATLPTSGEGVRGTRSIPALTAYFKAHEALAAWQLDSAEILFRQAIELDPKYPHANYWLAQVMAWRGSDGAEWLPNAQRAVMQSTRLSRRDSVVAGALLDLAQGQFPEACAEYEKLRAGKDSLDFAVWYGLGDCRARDTVIVRSAASPSGWAFRSSYGEALKAYSKALSLVPSAHREFAGVGFERLAKLMFTENDLVREGVPESDTLIWGAYPSLANDTLAFVPYPYQDLASGRAARPASTSAAVARNRGLLERLAAGWTSEFPRSATAYEALARTLEMEGRLTGGTAPDESAMRALDRARALATTPGDMRRLGVMRTRLLLVAGNFSGARAAADSLLAGAPANDPAASDTLKPLAALTGHVQRTVDFMRTEAPNIRFLSSTGRIVRAPLPVTEAARAMLGYVSLGAPVDSIGSSRQHVERALESYVPSSDRSFMREAVLNWPLKLAYPVAPRISLARAGGADDYLLDIQRAASNQDAPTVRALLHKIGSERGIERPGELSIYYVYQEAWLLLQVGDTAAATRELDASLNALPALGPEILNYVQDAGFLVRAMALRSDLAAKSGDEQTAGRWGAAVAELWAGADPALQNVVARMRTRAAAAGR